MGRTSELTIAHWACHKPRWRAAPGTLWRRHSVTPHACHGVPSPHEAILDYWGGESSRGIDCSGLPRRALRDALLAYGIRNLNGRAFRGYVEQWWFDASARALGEGYRDYTSPLGATGTIQEMDYGGLVPGDLAVTTSGVHILAYEATGSGSRLTPVSEPLRRSMVGLTTTDGFAHPSQPIDGNSSHNPKTTANKPWLINRLPAPSRASGA